ncbi:hypothetical protein ACX80I_06585 [Arthrobacter sp. MDT3-44]
MRFLLTVSVMILLVLLPAAPGTASTLAGPPAITTPDTASSTDPTPASTAPAGAAFGIRLLDIPASTQNDPRARTYIVDRLAPGSEISRRVRVENTTDTAATIHLYSGAARIDSGVFIGEDSSVRNELSTWTTLAEPEVALEAGKSADVMVTIDVPAEAPEGEQYGAVWAEMRSTTQDGGVVQANRAGIRIYLSVGPGNGAPADFTVASLTPSRNQNGNPELSALVTNTGGRALDITGDLTLSNGPGGLSAGPFSVQAPTTIVPGDSQNVTFSLPTELPNGPWTAGLTLKSGLVEHEASATVTFPQAGPGKAAVPATTGNTAGLIIAAIAGILVIGLLVAGLILRRRRHQHRATPSVP